MNFEKSNKLRFNRNNGAPRRVLPERFEYQPKYNQCEKRERGRALRKPDSNRRVINLEPQVKESRISYISKENSGYDKSVEMPSSFLEPSIIFDEKEGHGEFSNKNNIAKYDFKPIFRNKGKPKLMEKGACEIVQIQPKDNDSESLIAVSLSEIDPSEKSMTDQNQSHYTNHSNNKKQEVTKTI